MAFKFILGFNWKLYFFLHFIGSLRCAISLLYYYITNGRWHVAEAYATLSSCSMDSCL